jgi:hypothetical protein
MTQPSPPIYTPMPEAHVRGVSPGRFAGQDRTNAWRQEIRHWSREGAETTFQEFIDYNGNHIVESQELSWIDNTTDEERARLHQYITTDGRIGASGLPDPKRIHLEDGTRYHLTRPPKQEPCAKCGRIATTGRRQTLSPGPPLARLNLDPAGRLGLG